MVSRSESPCQCDVKGSMATQQPLHARGRTRMCTDSTWQALQGQWLNVATWNAVTVAGCDKIPTRLEVHVWPGRYLCQSPQTFPTQPPPPSTWATVGPGDAPVVTSYLGPGPLRPGRQTAGLRWLSGGTSSDRKARLKASVNAGGRDDSRQGGRGREGKAGPPGPVPPSPVTTVVSQAQNVIAKTALLCQSRAGAERGQLGRCDAGGSVAAGWGRLGVSHLRV